MNYQRLLKTANRLIKKSGVEHTFIRDAMGLYNPDLGTPRLNTQTTYSAYAVIDDENIGAQGDSTAKDYDIRMIAQAAPYEVNDTVTVNGVKMHITSTKPIKPGDTKLAQYVFLQK